MTQARKYRGMRTQALVAQYLAEHGWPYAESTGSGRLGTDVTGTPGICWEVKARTDLSPLAWVRQAERGTKPGVVPIVVFRSNGQGEDVSQYLAMLRVADVVDLLRLAGYGEPSTDSDGSNGSDDSGTTSALVNVD